MRALRNESGNATFYLIWITFIMGVMVILVLNMAKVFISNQEASVGVEQASYAATDVVMEAVRNAVSSYDAYVVAKFYETALEGETFPEEDKLEYQIAEKKNDLLSGGLLEGEAGIKAVDEIVTANLPGLDGKLKEYITGELNGEIGNMRGIVSDIMMKNFDDKTKLEIELFNPEGYAGTTYHVEIRSKQEFESIRYQSLLPTIRKDMEQKALGPPLRFPASLGYERTEYITIHP